jgi:hypothetical protein
MPRPDGIKRSAKTPAPVVHSVLESPDSSVLDLLDRLLDKGVMANGDVTLGVAGVDLIYLRLAALLCAADRVLPRDPLAPEKLRRKSRHRQPGGRRRQ